MRHYCTLFDRNYAVFGLALHNSLLEHAGDFQLHVLALDEECAQLLEKVCAPRMSIVRPGDLLQPRHQQAFAGMSFGQKCWSFQPLLCSWLLDNAGIEGITYLEADSCFYADPEVLFREIGMRSVSLVPHNYREGYDQTAVSGVYCVQFNYFRNDAVGRRFLDLWTDACMQYDRNKPKFFPGQTCMDVWPALSDGVCVVANVGAGVAPWNEARYRLTESEGRVLVDDQPLVFFHFHELAFVDDRRIFASSYRLSRESLALIYRRYARSLSRAWTMIRAAVPGFHYCKRFARPSLRVLLGEPSLVNLRNLAGYYVRAFRGRANLLKI